VLVGSLGRIPVGALTDRLGGRVMFPAVSFLTILPVLFLGPARQDSFARLLVGGFFLGIGGTAVRRSACPSSTRGSRRSAAASRSASSAPAWAAPRSAPHHRAAGRRRHRRHAVPAHRRLPRRVRRARRAAAARRPRPGRARRPSAVRRLPARCGCPSPSRPALLYAVGFGGYVAFSVYLPTYLREAYGSSRTTPRTRMAGFVVLAVLMRPLGGWLSDRVAPLKVLAGAFAVVCVCAAVQSATPDLMPVGTIAFLTMAACLGAASGAVFAHVAQRAPQAQVGSVTGLVGAAGGSADSCRRWSWARSTRAPARTPAACSPSPSWRPCPPPGACSRADPDDRSDA
jgi:NNP family nitrate/nitrite transporter-like MFS transporter